MKLSCIHCGGAFTVRGDQFGQSVACPHCHGVVNLPKADDGDPSEQDEQLTEPSPLLKNSVSSLVSVIFHTILLILLALFQWGGSGLPGEEGEDVMIGVLPAETLSDSQDESLDSAPEVEQEDSVDDTLEDLDVEPPTDISDPSAMDDVALSPTSLSGSSSGAFDLGVASAGGGGGGGWDGMIQQLRRNGLDVVIVFDSTGSMGGEIRAVKNQIQRIGTTLVRLVPKARISLVTYRDEGSGYVVKDPILPLTEDIQKVDEYLGPIIASGGGDHPEAVHEGLRAAIEKNDFRSSARKVILLFGDAPPHADKHRDCLTSAADFARQNRGVVSTVTCRQQTRLKEFIEIAQMGGGEAFLTSDDQQIMTQLMILVFGSQYRKKVLEAFELMEK